MGMVSFTLRSFYPQGKNPSYLLDRRLGGPQSRFGRGGEEKNSQSPSGIVFHKPTKNCQNDFTYFKLYFSGKWTE
jgi:hypothetical protein